MSFARFNLVDSLAEFLQREAMGNQLLGLHDTVTNEADRSIEAVSLREGADDLQLF